MTRSAGTTTSTTWCEVTSPRPSPTSRPPAARWSPPVSPVGLGQRDLGTLGFTTSLAFGRKLERIIRDPRIAVAHHAREHGSATSQVFVLAQGTASVDLTPSTERITEVVRRMEHYLGETKRCPLWDRLLREYHWERVVVDFAVQRLGV
ncbi:hypothetical protein ACFWOB_06175 [Streptomyces sp. NPDC058420]|uniref:hypothetical protein n=1 Tax=Streptomyces sp. NPDC058420 TaxID=3346489 RepID=UPI003663EBEB